MSPRSRRFAYTVCGALAGLAGLVPGGRASPPASRTRVWGYELDAIAAVVIGGN